MEAPRCHSDPCALSLRRRIPTVSVMESFRRFQSSRQAFCLTSWSLQLEKLADPVTAVAAIVARVPSRLLMTQYKTGTFCNHDDLLRQVAQARGKLKRGGTADSEGAARIVLADWRDGKLPFHTLPPSRGNEKHEHAAIVSQYAKDLDINAVIIQEEEQVLAELDNQFEMHGDLTTVRAATHSLLQFTQTSTHGGPFFRQSPHSSLS